MRGNSWISPSRFPVRRNLQVMVRMGPIESMLREALGPLEATIRLYGRFSSP